MSGAGTQPSPKLLDDVGTWLFFEGAHGSGNTYIVGSVAADRYVTVPESKMIAVRAFMQRLDGSRTLGQIRHELAAEQGLQLNVEALYRKFQRAGLLADGGAQSGDIEEMSATAVTVSIGGILRIFAKLSSLANPLAGLGLVMISAALLWFAVDPAFRTLMALPSFGSLAVAQTTAVFLVVGCGSVLMHELSHCFTAAAWGIRSGTLRLQLYLGLFPIAALKFAGLYTLPPRGRLAVWSAGVFANLSATAVGLLGMRTLWPGSPLLEAIVTVNWLMTILNLAPLLPTDGYFLLTTLAKEPNIRVRAWGWLRHPFRPGKKRPSWFVLAYLFSTVWLLLATIWNHLQRIAGMGNRFPLWESLFSVVLITLLVMTLWRGARRKETD